MAESYAAQGVLLPHNVLWCYYITERNESAACSIWQKHFQTSSTTITYGSILSEASKLRDEKIIIKLIENLKTSETLRYDLGGLYTSLLHMYCDKDNYAVAFKTLQNAVADGLQIESIHTSALERVKRGIEKNGEEFPYTIQYQ